MSNKQRFLKPSVCFFVLLAVFLSSDVDARRRFRRPPRPVVKIGNDILSISRKPSPTQTVDIAPLLGLNNNQDIARKFSGARYPPQSHRPNYFVHQQTPSFRNLNGFSKTSLNNQIRNFNTPNQFQSTSSHFYQGTRRIDDGAQTFSEVDKAKISQMAAQAAARQRARALKAQSVSGTDGGKSHQPILPLWYQYKLRKQARAYAKYLRTMRLLSLIQNQSPVASSGLDLALLTQSSFQNSPYSSLLNSTFVPANPVSGNGTTNSTQENDQLVRASERSEYGIIDEYTSLQREIEKGRRRLLEVFPPPEAEVPFGERTVLMVRFPPVPHQKKKDIVKLKAAYDIDGGITFGGPRWNSFGTPFNPYEHPWDKPKGWKKDPPKLVLAEADKPSSYGVIITQNYMYRPSIRFTNSDPKLLAKNNGDILNGGPSIVAQLAKALAEGNRITNSYFLSKAALQGKKWSSAKKKPPFVIIHLDTYTKRSNQTGAFGLDDQFEANYANGTIIYPTLNDPSILASTKFEFHDGKEIDTIFDQPLAAFENGYGWHQVSIHPKGIKEIRNFLKLLYKVHQEAHAAGKRKVDELKQLGDKLERPAFADSKPLLPDQQVDRSVSWMHTSSVGIRSLSEDDDHFPYSKRPLIDVSKDYGNYLRA